MQSGFPVNRLITFLGPFIAILAGAIASWLALNFPGLGITDAKPDVQLVAQTLTFMTGAVITWALHHKYLTGWQNWEQATLALSKAEQPVLDPHKPPPPPLHPSTNGHADHSGSGASTWPGRTLKRGAHGDHVQAWQQQMQARGFTDITADGFFGEASAERCRWLQLYLRLPPTGEVDERTWQQTWAAR